MEKSAKSVLMIGLRSDSVDYSKWPQLSPEKLEAAFRHILEALKDAGYHARWCLTDSGETAAAQVQDALLKERVDLVLIGAGVRTDEEHFLLFEHVINLVHQHAPQAKIAFNSTPFDTLGAIKRWL